MPTSVWDRWLRGGPPPSAQASSPTAGYSPLTGLSEPSMPANYRPDVIRNAGRDDPANVKGLGNLGNTVGAGWYKSVPGMSFADFISPENADWFRRKWVAEHKLGPKTEQALERFAPVPHYWLSVMGHEPKFGLNQANAPQVQADLMGKLYGRLLGPSGNQKIDPRQIMQRIVGATWKNDPAKNGLIEAMIASPSLDGATQARNFWSLVNSTVGRLMPPHTMQAYQQIVDREAALFNDFMRENPALSLTFPAWMKQRLGPTAGL